MKAHQDAGEPVISVDAKKKEQLGQLPAAGREWRPKGDPIPVEDHSFFAGGPEVELDVPMVQQQERTHGHHPTALGPSGSRRSHRAAGSSRVQVVVLAAARLRALHLDPLVTGSRAQGADQPRRKKNGLPALPELECE